MLIFNLVATLYPDFVHFHRTEIHQTINFELIQICFNCFKNFECNIFRAVQKTKIWFIFGFQNTEPSTFLTSVKMVFQ